MIVSLASTAKGTVISLRGRLDSVTSPAAQSELEKCLDGVQGPVILECSGLDYVSSAGLRVLLFLAKKKSGLILQGLNEQVREAIEIAGFSVIFKVE